MLMLQMFCAKMLSLSKWQVIPQSFERLCLCSVQFPQHIARAPVLSLLWHMVPGVALACIDYRVGYCSYPLKTLL